MIALTIYTRPGCHLCEDMKRVVQRAVDSSPERVSIQEIDISGDPDLEQRYGREIPVLLVGGRKAAKYRVTEEAVVRILAAMTTESL